MIQNTNAGSHDVYLPGRRSARVEAPRAAQREVLVDGVRPNAKGSLAERCAWMKLRQQQQRRQA